MANYLSLPLELRQQILFAAFAAADEEDLLAFARLCRFLATSGGGKVARRIQNFAQTLTPKQPHSRCWDVVLPLRYAATMAHLVTASSLLIRVSSWI